MKIIILIFIALSLPIVADARFETYRLTSMYYLEAKANNPDISYSDLTRMVARQLKNRGAQWQKQETSKIAINSSIYGNTRTNVSSKIVSRKITFQEMALNKKN